MVVGIVRPSLRSIVRSLGHWLDRAIETLRVEAFMATLVVVVLVGVTLFTVQVIVAFTSGTGDRSSTGSSGSPDSGLSAAVSSPGWRIGAATRFSAKPGSDACCLWFYLSLRTSGSGGLSSFS